MATRIEAARLLTMQAAERKNAGERADLEAGMAKLFATETAEEVALEAMRSTAAPAIPGARRRTDLPRRARPDPRRGLQRDPAAGDCRRLLERYAV
jgi:alkylation response protein AidB-like acyl-CoA dehydrogenase